MTKSILSEYLAQEDQKMYFFRAIDRRDLPLVKKLMPSMPRSLRDKTALTPVMRAVAAGDHPEILGALLSKFDPKDTHGVRGTALIMAALQNRVESVTALLPLSDMSATNDKGQTALAVAAEAGHANIVDILLPVSDALAKDKKGATALMMAAAEGYADCLEKLAPFSALAEQDRDGDTALHLAVYAGSPECVRVLLSAKNGAASATMKSLRGSTPLHIAVVNSKLNVVELLAPVSDVSIPNNKGQTVWDVLQEQVRSNLGSESEIMCSMRAEELALFSDAASIAKVVMAFPEEDRAVLFPKCLAVMEAQEIRSTMRQVEAARDPGEPAEAPAANIAASPRSVRL